MNFVVASKLYDRITDGTHDSPKKTNTGKPLITSKHIKGRNINFCDAYLISEDDFNKINSRSKVQKWDVIISMIGEYCGFCYIERNSEINYAVKNVGIFSTGSKLEAEWLYYYLNSSLGKAILKSVKSGSSQPYLTLGALRDLPILDVNLELKKDITKILSNLDSKIELNNRINRELEQMAKLLYDYWFVQFDFPNEQGKPYKSSGGKMVYNKELKREIPEAWEIANLASWILKDKSGDWGKETMQGNYTEQVSCIRGADLNGLKGQGAIKSPTRYTLKKNAHKQLESHDLIVEISGGSPTQSTGRLAYLIDETLERFQNPLICSNFCKAVTLKEEKQLYYFAQTWQMLYDNDALFCWEGKTSGIKNLLFDGFVNSYNVPVPNNELVEKFNKTAHSVEVKKQANLKEIQHLTQLRDWLLPMLMNGQITVKQAQQKVAETLYIAAEPQAKY